MTAATMPSKTVYVPEDYVHSANSLFHFVKSVNYLINALQQKNLYPRYCVEDVRYLDLTLNGEHFEDVAILQKSGFEI